MKNKREVETTKLYLTQEREREREELAMAYPKQRAKHHIYIHKFVQKKNKTKGIYGMCNLHDQPLMGPYKRDLIMIVNKYQLIK